MLGKHPLGLYEKALPIEMDWDRRLKTAGSLGFEFMEISIDETDMRLERLDWDARELEYFNRIVNDSGIFINSMCLSGHRRFPLGSADFEKRKKAREIMRKAIDFSKETGIGIIQLAGYDVYYEESTKESRKLFLEGLQDACEIAENKGIILAMEIMDTPFINSITKNKYYEEVLDSPNYKVYPDLGNLSAWGNDVKSELILGFDSIVAVHLKDTLAVTDDFPGKFKCVEFGSGCVDFPMAFKTLEELGYTGPYLIEMWTDSQKDDITEINKAKRFIERKFEEGLK